MTQQQVLLLLPYRIASFKFSDALTNRRGPESIARLATPDAPRGGGGSQRSIRLTIILAISKLEVAAGLGALSTWVV